MRPTADVLNEFYDLVELNANKRFNAVGRLLLKAKSDSSIVDYCIERLVTGLSSPRGAARFGYSAALVLLLSEFHESWTVEKLFELADKKLDLHDKESGSANAIGRHLLACAIFQSKAYTEVEVVLIERELEVYRAYPTLGMSIAQVVAEIAVEMEKKRFKSTVLPLLKGYLDTAITSTSVEFIYLALLLKDRFPKCDSAALSPLLKALLISSRASGQFSDVYSRAGSIFTVAAQKNRTNSSWQAEPSTADPTRKGSVFPTDLETILLLQLQPQKTSKYPIETRRTVFERDDKCTVMFVVSSMFHHRTALGVGGGEGVKQFRGCSIFVITEFCKFTEEILSAVKEDAELIEVINALDTDESFDSLTGSNLIDHLVGRLSHSGVAEWIQKADKPWCLRHICAAFPHWSNEAKVEALTNLLQRPKSQEIQYAVGNCIDSMFKMKVRAGELVNVSLIEGGEDVLQQTATAIFGKDVVKSGLKKMKSCEYAKRMASSDEVSEGYTSNAEELVMVAKGDEDGLKVLLDQLLAHLSQPLKYHRTVVYYAFVQLLPHFKKEHVSHIIETMMMDDDELADEEGSEGESSNDEDEEMDDGEAAAEQSESESIDDEEGVDPERLNRLESALGKAAVKRKGDAIDEEEVVKKLAYLGSISSKVFRGRKRDDDAFRENRDIGDDSKVIFCGKKG
ncbi:hypothetical protein TELCIR_03869 [Teladorsagia circumcincta]|uniref:Uncharacterized protein n=1 Tax=Teladorsagia circumcincta TaxID=45464 RepID=A0A2G9UV58_TELCI|nr:hypothetical protein TELCIR_03869 [Teladorsagia circumcincta]